MFNKLSRYFVMTASTCLLTITSFASQAAGLPQMEDPSRGRGSGIWQTIQNYAYDAVMLIALLVISGMFIGVCYHAYVVYAEIQQNKKTWGQFGLTVAVGAILLVIGIWLLTEGTGIL